MVFQLCSLILKIMVLFCFIFLMTKCKHHNKTEVLLIWHFTLDQGFDLYILVRKIKGALAQGRRALLRLCSHGARAVSCRPAEGPPSQLSHWVCHADSLSCCLEGDPESINEDRYSDYFYAKKLFTRMPKHVSLSVRGKTEDSNG